jgi:Zn-dependent protease/CBS domain-containing protein
MGVDLRIHTFFLLMLGFFMLSTNVEHAASWRGMVLWFLLMGAVMVREIARCITAAYHGLQLRSILLLPIGGLFAYASPESAERAGAGGVQVALAVVGPLANLAIAAVIGGLIVGTSPHASLFVHPWVTPAHLVRSVVWLNVFLGVLNLVPAYPLDAGRLMRAFFVRKRGEAQATRAVSGLGQGFGLLAAFGGIVLMLLPNTGLASGLSPWLIIVGFFIFVGAQLEDQGLMYQSVVDTVRMRDVMLTDFSTLSPSDTLQDALYKAIHTLQDDFPVTRGANLVGIVSRQSILDALRMDGNGYVQSVMSRAFQVAQPDDSLGTTIRNMATGRGLSLVPVTEGERIVGIVTLQNLMHSMGLLAEHRRLERQE